MMCVNKVLKNEIKFFDLKLSDSISKFKPAHPYRLNLFVILMPNNEKLKLYL